MQAVETGILLLFSCSGASLGFSSLSVSAVFLGLPFFPLHQASADPSLKSISLSVGPYNFPASPSLCLSWRKKGCSKKRAVDLT